MWHTRIQTKILEEDFITLTKYHNDSNSRECNQKRAALLGFDDDIKIAPGANVRLGENGSLGKNVFIGICSYVNGDVVIEEDVLIGPFCSLTSNSHLFNVAQRSFRGKNLNRAIRIGRGTWLSSGVAVNPGVTIGQCNLILPNSVVTKSTGDLVIVGGNPARVCGRIDKENGQLLWDNSERKNSTPNNGESKNNATSESNGELLEYRNWIAKETGTENGANRAVVLENTERNTDQSTMNDAEKIVALELKVQSLESKLEEMRNTIEKLSSLLLKDSS
jgi:acetyltransferase-like isoleucine patch superfamily enzyme